ncbi:hypothetical protein [Kordia sp.]|uniref:hypothetical protein n=1 Tax=Kordia sp. TaxID=1965332 RepID=UPI0025BD5AF9|nr:hypothetical protein [Kordia sp.]MCH2197107.1 hypothetical protein [Kordia sp.]
MKIDKLKELILDSIIDDFYNLWEPYSELKEYFLDDVLTEEVFKKKFINNFIELLHDNLIDVYVGISFSGEEKKVQFPHETFLDHLLEEWKSKGAKEIRFITSQAGARMSPRWR